MFKSEFATLRMHAYFVGGGNPFGNLDKTSVLQEVREDSDCDKKTNFQV